MNFIEFRFISFHFFHFHFYFLFSRIPTKRLKIQKIKENENANYCETFPIKYSIIENENENENENHNKNDNENENENENKNGNKKNTNIQFSEKTEIPTRKKLQKIANYYAKNEIQGGMDFYSPFICPNFEVLHRYVLHFNSI